MAHPVNLLKEMELKYIRKLFVLCLLLLIGTMVSAQNRIDELVENHSCLGSSTFTSVVDRDPGTRKINKVVKVLQIPGHQAKTFQQAFLKERNTGSFGQKRDGQDETLTLTVETKDRVRIYMLQMKMAGGISCTSAKVTVIVKYI